MNFDLHQAVETALANQRIGQPVFIRYLIHGNEPSSLDQLLPVLTRWLGQGVQCRQALGEAARQPSFALQTANGSSALLSFASNDQGTSGVDLTILGTRGAIYHPLELPVADDALEASAGCNPPAPSGPRYGVLLVSGARTHQEDYARSFAADPRCQLVAVTDERDVDAERRRLNARLAESLRVPYLTDLDEAVGRADVHIVSICAPPERRARIAVRCAEAGKHLYLDKSLAPERKEAYAIVGAVREAGVRSHMFSFVTAPWARRAKRFIERGLIGEIRAVHADTFFAKGRAGTVQKPGVRQEEYPPSRHQLVEAKRELDNVGVYPITLIPWLTGRAFSTVHALTANYFFAEHQKHDVEDFGVLAGTLEDDVPVTIAAGRIGWSSHPAGGVNRVILVGNERTMIVDANRPRLEIYADEAPWTPPSAHPDDPMGFWTSTQQESGLRQKRTWVPLASSASDAGYFLDRLELGQQSEMSVREAAKATEVLFAAYKSAATGETIRLPMTEP
jgi:predicted dehydrogenase